MILPTYVQNFYGGSLCDAVIDRRVHAPLCLVTPVAWRSQEPYALCISAHSRLNKSSPCRISTYTIAYWEHYNNELWHDSTSNIRAMRLYCGSLCNARGTHGGLNMSRPPWEDNCLRTYVFPLFPTGFGGFSLWKADTCWQVQDIPITTLRHISVEWVVLDAMLHTVPISNDV
jgi:hypothetical protein